MKHVTNAFAFGVIGYTFNSVNTSNNLFHNFDSKVVGATFNSVLEWGSLIGMSLTALSTIQKGELNLKKTAGMIIVKPVIAIAANIVIQNKDFLINKMSDNASAFTSSAKGYYNDASVKLSESKEFLINKMSDNASAFTSSAKGYYNDASVKLLESKDFLTDKFYVGTANFQKYLNPGFELLKEQTKDIYTQDILDCIHPSLGTFCTKVNELTDKYFQTIVFHETH